MNDYMGEIVVDNKLVPKYPSIKHLTGSKMIDNKDSLIGKEAEEFLTVKKKFDFDTVYITEKIDGSNVSVYKKDNLLYPLNRMGYDIRQGIYREGTLFNLLFAEYVSMNQNRFMDIMEDDQLLVFEFMMAKHTISYSLHHEPLVLLDIINNKERKRKPYKELKSFAEKNKFILPNLIHTGDAMSVKDALLLLGKGKHGASPMPEGVVYRYERRGEFYIHAKYVNGFVNPTYRDYQDMCVENMKPDDYNKFEGWEDFITNL